MGANLTCGSAASGCLYDSQCKTCLAATKESIDNEYKVRSLLHFEEFHLEDRLWEKKKKRFLA